MIKNNSEYSKYFNRRGLITEVVQHVCIFSRYEKPFWNIGKDKLLYGCYYLKKFSLLPGTLLDVAPSKGRFVCLSHLSEKMSYCTILYHFF